MPVPTSAEIRIQCEHAKGRDFFGFESAEYVPYMDAADMRPFLKDGTTDEQIAEIQQPLDRDAMVQHIKNYMPFAWDKANNCRGISANRSIGHFVAWTFLAGDKEFSDELSALFDDGYEHYGKAILIRICEFYGLDANQWDDGVRVNSEDELDED